MPVRPYTVGVQNVLTIHIHSGSSQIDYQNELEGLCCGINVQNSVRVTFSCLSSANINTLANEEKQKKNH